MEWKRRWRALSENSWVSITGSVTSGRAGPVAHIAENLIFERNQSMQSYTIRPATPDDAYGINTYLRCIYEEPNNMVSYSHGEFLRTVEEERARIEDAGIALEYAGKYGKSTISVAGIHLSQSMSHSG